MFLDNFNPSLLKMAVVWYAFAFGIRGWIQLREKGAGDVLKGAVLVFAFTAIGALLVHLYAQNYLLLTSTVFAAIVVMVLSFILCHDGASDHDLKMFRNFIIGSPVMILVLWLILAVVFAVGHYLLDWLRL